MGLLGIALASGSAFVGATFLAYYDKPGWGWLILAGVLVAEAASEWRPS